MHRDLSMFPLKQALRNIMGRKIIQNWLTTVYTLNRLHRYLLSNIIISSARVGAPFDSVTWEIDSATSAC